jgi:hypothetical protein
MELLLVPARLPLLGLQGLDLLVEVMLDELQLE